MLAPIFLAVVAAAPGGDFDRLVDEFFDVHFRNSPSEATSEGLHQYDTLVEDYSPAARSAYGDALRKFRQRFTALPAAELTPENAADRELVLSHIESELLELETIRPWERHPDSYARTANYGVFLLNGRNFAPHAERLKSVIAREKQIPRLLASARSNLKNPPKVFTEIALEKLPGIIDYFRRDLPAAFQEVQDESLLAEFRASNAATIAAFDEYRTFLRDDVLPNSHGDFRIGAENFRLRLLHEEMIDIPLDRLKKIGYSDLRANQELFRQTAAKINPKATPREVLIELTRDHPTADSLLDEVRGGLDELRRFIAERRIVTIPSPTPPIVMATPSYKRAVSWASLDPPGPYETRANEAYYFVTPPDLTRSAKEIQEHLESFCRAELSNLSVHEAYPGHYTQFLWVQRAKSKVRKLLGCGSNSEGWAHYVEQMMLDEGLGNGDPKLRLAQLHDALLRNARFIVGLEMHAGEMSFDEAVDFFMQQGYQTRVAATIEARRGTSDATYLKYTLGKLAILKLREDYRKLRGDKFSLQEFHDRFLQEGFPPLKLIRRVMLGDDSPIL